MCKRLQFFTQAHLPLVLTQRHTVCLLLEALLGRNDCRFQARHVLLSSKTTSLLTSSFGSFASAARRSSLRADSLACAVRLESRDQPNPHCLQSSKRRACSLHDILFQMDLIPKPIYRHLQNGLACRRCLESSLNGCPEARNVSNLLGASCPVCASRTATLPELPSAALWMPELRQAPKQAARRKFLHTASDRALCVRIACFRRGACGQLRTARCPHSAPSRTGKVYRCLQLHSLLRPQTAANRCLHGLSQVMSSHRSPNMQKDASMKH